MLHDHRVCELCHALVDSVHIFDFARKVVETYEDDSWLISGLICNVNAIIIWGLKELRCRRCGFNERCTALDGSFTSRVSISNLSEPFERAFCFIGYTAEKSCTVSIARGDVAFWGGSVIWVCNSELWVVVWKVLQVPVHERGARSWRVEGEGEEPVAFDWIDRTNVVWVDESSLGKDDW